MYKVQTLNPYKRYDSYNAQQKESLAFFSVLPSNICYLFISPLRARKSDNNCSIAIVGRAIKKRSYKYNSKNESFFDLEKYIKREGERDRQKVCKIEIERKKKREREE